MYSRAGFLGGAPEGMPLDGALSVSWVAVALGADGPTDVRLAFAWDPEGAR